ncbi:SH3 domain-containing protein [Leptospira tipperaryensis]|uniref:SH3 domain-containing protein n=1 Tax=Leptospira tipperaryensis TaxID=2564040 RepID=UPI001FE1C2C9|nr:SH3 domain-containing protein [Leptospira tipperaryensis]
MRIIFIPLLIVILIGCDKSGYRYVAGRNGLFLRDLPQQNSTKIILIPFNSKIKIQGKLTNSTVIDDVEGQWVKAEFEDYSGFVFSPYLSENRIPENLNIKGDYIGIYGADNSIYGKIELREENVGILTLNFCHELVSPRIKWEKDAGLLFIKLNKEDEHCCPEIKNKTLPFRINKVNQLEYIGEMIYACGLGGSGRLLTKMQN